MLAYAGADGPAPVRRRSAPRAQCRRLWCEPDERTIPPPGTLQGMAPCGDGLMRPPPHRPLEAEAALLAAAGQRQEEAADLRHGDRDQAGIAAPLPRPRADWRPGA